MKKKCLCGRCGEIDRDPIVPERCSACGAPTLPGSFEIERWVLFLGLFIGAAIVFRATLW